MADNTGPITSLKGLVQWALTPPQAYVVYAGTLQPKKPVETSRSPVSAPKN